MSLRKRDAALFQECQDQLEVLEFLDGDGVQLVNPREELRVFFEVDRGGGGLSFEMGVVNQDGGEVVDNLRQPVGWNFFSKQKHASIYRKSFGIAKIREIGE